MTMRYNAHSSSGNLDTLAAGTVVGGTAVDLGDNSRQKVRSLSALVTVDMETTSITATIKWQVSNDGTTWVDVANGSQNAAGVVLATGTAGADASVARAFPAPDAIYGWRKARIALVTAGATGAAVDTYAFGYCYRTGLG
jgi:hypothetical protein